MKVEAMGLNDGSIFLTNLEFFILQKNMWQEIIKAIIPFFLFLTTFDPQNVHNMFAIMLDPCFRRAYFQLLYGLWHCNLIVVKSPPYDSKLSILNDSIFVLQ
jgi:hypothetical protein